MLVWFGAVRSPALASRDLPVLVEGGGERIEEEVALETIYLLSFAQSFQLRLHLFL